MACAWVALALTLALARGSSTFSSLPTHHAKAKCRALMETCSHKATFGTPKCAGFLHVAGFFPLNGSSCHTGYAAAAAAALAVQDVNSVATSPTAVHSAHGQVLGDHCLVLHIFDTRGDASSALSRVDDLLNTPWTGAASIDIVVGALDSEVCETMQHLLQWAHVAQVSYGATSPTLSDTSKFPTFVRTVPSDVRIVEGFADLVENMGWEIVTLLSVHKEFGLRFSALMSKHLLRAGKHIEHNLLFTPGPSLEVALQKIRRSESRVIILHCATDDAAKVLLQAHELGMMEEDYTWLGTEWAHDSLPGELLDELLAHKPAGALGRNAAERELETMREAMLGLVALRPGYALPSTDAAYGKATKLASRIQGDLVADMERGNVSAAQAGCGHAASRMVDPYALFAYDAVVLGAMGIDGAMRANRTRNHSATLAALRSVGAHHKLRGATGQLEISAKGDRVMNMDLVNLVRTPEGGQKWQRVGLHTPAHGGEAAQLRLGSEPIVWSGGHTSTPSDRQEHHVSLEALYLFFFLVCLVLSICVGNWLHEKHFYYLPESGATILLGVVLGFMLRGFSALTGTTTALIEMTKFDTEIFTLFLLPIIIFAAGFNLKKGIFFSNIAPILLTAFVGTTISSFLVGGSLFALGNAGAFGFGSLSLTESLAFGALISAVDPVATLAIFGALGVEQNLNMKVFGESVINDGVSIVLFRVFCSFITTDVNAGSIAAGFAQFVIISLGSTLVGVVCTLGLALTLKHFDIHSFVMEAGLVLLVSYTAFAGAEALHLSGIISSLFCGISMNHWAYHNFSYEGELLARKVVKMFSLLADTVIFMQVGLNVVVTLAQPEWAFIGATLLLCIVGRAANIFPLSFLYNLTQKKRVKKIAMKHQIMWFHAGLRGAIAFALSLDFPSQHVPIVVNTTMWVILFTIFLLGGTSVPLLKALDIPIGIASNEVQGVKKSKHSASFTHPLQVFDRKVLLPLCTWRFGWDGSDSYIEDPQEAKLERIMSQLARKEQSVSAPSPDGEASPEPGPEADV